jgi:hypothetical protein
MELAREVELSEIARAFKPKLPVHFAGTRQAPSEVFGREPVISFLNASTDEIVGLID